MFRWISVSMLSCLTIIFLTARYAYANDLDTLLTGEFIIASYNGEFVGQISDSVDLIEEWEPGANWGLATFDGQGNGTWQEIRSTEGTETEYFNYSVDDNGTFSVSGFNENDIGIIGSSGQSIMIARATSSIIPEFSIAMGLKKSTGMSDASLDGDYIMATHYAEYSGSTGDSLDSTELWEPGANWGLATFDGQGNGTWQEIRSTEGTETEYFNYSVNDDGTFSVSGFNENDIGIVGSDGQSIIIARATSSIIPEFSIAMGLKKSTDKSDASLDGAYIMASHNADFVGETGDSLDITELWELGGNWGLATFDGLGNGHWQEIRSTEGIEAYDFSYSVNTDGTFAISGDDDQIIRIVSQDGQNILSAEIDPWDFNVAFGIAKIYNPNIVIIPDSLDFGEVLIGSSSSLDLKVISTGTDTLHVGDIHSSDSTFSISDTSFSLAPAESLDITVTFSPTVIRSYSGTLTILHDAKGSTTVPIAGRGAGIVVPGIDVSPDTLKFHQVEIGQGTLKTLCIRSTGTATLTVSDIEPSSSVLTIADTSFILLPSESTNVAMTFTPTDVQAYVESLAIFSNASPESLVVPIFGSGIPAKPSVVSMNLNDPSPTCAGPVDFSFTFDRKMDTSVGLDVSYGLDSPYEDQVVTANPGWASDSIHWTGTDTIEVDKGDGLNTVKIQGAQDLEGSVMNTDTSRSFFIDTVPPTSMISAPRYSGSTSFLVQWSGTDQDPSCGIATYDIYTSIDGAAFTEWITNTVATSATYNGSAGHYYRFCSTISDSAGNQETVPQAHQCTTAIDLTPPHITATTVWADTSFSGPFIVQADIDDSVKIGLAVLWYRTANDTLWQADTMTTCKDIFSGTIPEQTSTNTLVMYYISAQDISEPVNIRTDPSGAPASFFSFHAYATLFEEPSAIEIPYEFNLCQNIPNPFNSNTQIHYSLPKSCRVRLEIFNILGQRVAILVDEVQTEGYHSIYWNGKNNCGQLLASGIYIYRLQTEEKSLIRKMVFVR